MMNASYGLVRNVLVNARTLISFSVDTFLMIDNLGHFSLQITNTSSNNAATFGMPNFCFQTIRSGFFREIHCVLDESAYGIAGSISMKLLRIPSEL